MKNKDYILIKASTVDEANKKIEQLHLEFDICIGELFPQVEIKGLNVEQVVEVYATVYNKIEGDEICRIDEDGMRYSIGT